MQVRQFSCGIGYPPKPEENPVRFSFLYTKENDKQEVLAREGETLLEVAHNNKIELEGACEQSLACSTCHVILEEEIFENLESPKEEEEDLLDLAYGLTLTSRLGCQVKVTRAMEGMLVKLPSNTRNFYVDKNKLDLHK
ncbi:probable yah1-ferredoxin of the mitochondrial matrix [Stylonychia lemnae]|uniref:2Fe-2S ferredoxin n=1 Tax=Stylonychia lemnae TaxID=5949 RepID=A0A077ZSM7_STYLE|nr:probable yah1-ferredoxin of the mitochondrial matrix [Stylonychia lemnae]|eukprot:CDW72888.1 probable yah1-ferredoxin of the mitochondrial matrix [Stylonychia lemnae]